MRLEYEYALSLKRKDLLRPVYWEDPYPSPPPELGRLPFQKIDL